MSPLAPTESQDVLLLRRTVQGPSLLSQLAMGWGDRYRRAVARAPRIQVSASPKSLRLAAALILSIPLSIKAGAELLAWHARQDGEAFAATAEGRRQAEHRLEQVRATREAMAEALRRPTIGQSLAMLATTLPEGTTLHRVSRERSGALTVVVEASDPDRLRAALDGSPALSTFKEIGQGGSEADGLRVTLRSFEL